MFILRKITGEGAEINVSIGGSYNLIDKERHNKEFELLLTEKFKRLNEDIIHAFLVYKEGSEVMPLYKTQYNYMMTETGKTFCNLTHNDKR